ncbi:MAG: hypothetical protein VX966_03310 [Chloroflexota bacterium]|nr:hypothetical protein [Chloroflexota bacterium]
MSTIIHLQELVRTLDSRINELEKELSVARGTAAGIREAYSITKRMQSDWERIDGMDSTIKRQSEYIDILQRHIKKLEGVLESEGLGEYIQSL